MAPETRVTATPPAVVALALDSGTSGICVAWLLAVMPGWSTPYGPLPVTTETHLPSTPAALAAGTPS
jgi:hypothetical protein